MPTYLCQVNAKVTSFHAETLRRKAIIYIPLHLCAFACPPVGGRETLRHHFTQRR